MALRQTIVLPSGQQIRDVALHTPGEINAFLSSLDPYMYGTGIDLFEECPDKFVCVTNAVDFRSPDSSFGAQAYRPIDDTVEPRFFDASGAPVSPIDRDGNRQNTRCLYIIGVRNASEWRSRTIGNDSLMSTGDAELPPNSVIIGPYDGDYRKLVFYKVCVRADSRTPIGRGPDQIPETLLGAGQVYAEIDPVDILTEIDTTSAGLWSNNVTRLITPNTASSAITNTANYLLEVYNNPPDDSECQELQYKIVYADYEGKGARDLGGKDNETLTKAMYTQYANILLPKGQNRFKFNDVEEDYVYIIDVARDRYKYAMDPGNWQITIGSVNFSLDLNSDSDIESMQTASFKEDMVTLVDTLTSTKKSDRSIYFSSKGYDIVLGTIEEGIGTLYVTASLASSSLATAGSDQYIISNTSQQTNTVIVQGARAYTWNDYSQNSDAQLDINSNYTMSFKVSETLPDGFIKNTYEGAWTASISLPPGSTISPTTLSGSAEGSLIYNSDYQLQNYTGSRTLEGVTDRINRKVSLVRNAVTYPKGLFKWGVFDDQALNLFGSIPFNKTIFSGSYIGKSDAIFYTDGWGFREEIDDIEDTALNNGFVLIPIRKESYGKFYPNHGILVLSGKKMDSLGFNTNRSVDRNGYNTYRLFHSMKLILDNELTDLSGDLLGFIGRSVDIKYNKYCFIRVGNRRFNYSNNPTYQSGSLGDIVEDFQRQNKAYFTSIGIYNANKELLAVGKISKALMSSMTKESLFTVKIGQ